MDKSIITWSIITWSIISLAVKRNMAFVKMAGITSAFHLVAVNCPDKLAHMLLLGTLRIQFSR